MLENIYIFDIRSSITIVSDKETSVLHKTTQFANVTLALRIASIWKEPNMLLENFHPKSKLIIKLSIR